MAVRTGRRAVGIALMLAAALVIAGAITACGTGGGTPTPTSSWPTPRPPIPASPTVNPVAPMLEGPISDSALLDSPGVSNPTQAALPAEGQPDQDLPTITPQPTAASLPLAITGADGLVLRATLYNAPVHPSAGVLLLHDRSADSTAWAALIARLQVAGYAVMALDLRGFGATGSTADWTLAPGDVNAALALLAELPLIDGSRLVVIGAEIGANLGLNACADRGGCAAAVLISPALELRGITTPGAMARMGARPVLILTGENDNNNPADSIALDGMAAGDHQLVIAPVSGGGMALLAAQPALIDQIAAWLVARVPPVQPGP